MTSPGEIALRLQDQGWRGLLPLLPHDAAPNVRLGAEKAAEVERARQGTGTVGAGRVVAAARLARLSGRRETIERWRVGPASMSGCGPAMPRPGSRSSTSTCCTPRQPARSWRCCAAGSTARASSSGASAGAQVPDPGAGHGARHRSRSTVVEIDGQRHMVEVLGAGQQAVVAGIHPKTGRPYFWPAGGLEETEPGKLPLVTPAELAEIVAACSKMLLRYGPAVGRKGRSLRAECNAEPKPLHELRARDPGAGQGRRRVRGQHRLEPRRLGGLGLRACAAPSATMARRCGCGSPRSRSRPPIPPRPRRSGATPPRPSATGTCAPAPAPSSPSPRRRVDPATIAGPAGLLRWRRRRIPIGPAPPCGSPSSSGSSRGSPTAARARRHATPSPAPWAWARRTVTLEVLAQMAQGETVHYYTPTLELG